VSRSRLLHSALDRHRLKVRVLSLVAFGVAVPLLALGLSAREAMARLEQRLLDDRELLARSVAGRLGDVIGSELELLDAIPAARGFDLEDGDLEPERRALHEASLRLHALFDEVLILDREGRAVLSEPLSARPLPEVADLVHRALEGRRPVVSGLLGREPGVRRLYAIVPAKSWQGEGVGAVAGAIDPEGSHLSGLLASYRLAKGERLDLLDGAGAVVASTEASTLFTTSDHADVVAALIRDRRSASRACHGCHEASRGEGVREVAAFAPTAVAPWLVSLRRVEQPAFGTARELFTGMGAAGALFMLVALGFAAGAANSVTRPLTTLTREAERLAAGNLQEPLPELGRDEVGRLGRALEHMRVALQRSLDSAERANAELEQRVAERTAQLLRLYQDLQEREDARAKLLRKVITAQEDERKRIARDLHDETTQSLAALVMRLEAALAAPAGEMGQRLKEAEELAVHALDEVHRLIVDLRPSVLDDLGLRSAIAWYCDRALRQKGLSVRFESSDLDNRRLPMEIEVAVFRAVQEALSNIAKHAEADAVLIQCDVRGGALTIEIEDDGKGFDSAALSPPGAGGHGWGLLGIRERMEIIGGTARIDSAPGQGTRVVLSAPMPEVEEVSHG
jgi:signal transduction histidine kinase